MPLPTNTESQKQYYLFIDECGDQKEGKLYGMKIFPNKKESPFNDNPFPTGDTPIQKEPYDSTAKIQQKN